MDTILSYQKTLDKLLMQTTECAYFISDYSTIKQFMQRAAFHIVTNADDMIARFEASFGELKINLILGTSLQTAIVSYRILQTVENIEAVLYLNKLNYLDNVGWDSGRTCLRGTRQHWINEILKWASSSSSVDETCPRRIYVLAGPPGCGKSTIAHTVAQAFHPQNGRLAASLFLRNHSESRSRINSQTVSSTIIYQLANYHPAIMARVAGALKSDASLATADIGRQFPQLLVGTINPGTTKDGGALAMIGPALIILDDLQEISDIREQNRIVTAIADYFINLPPNFRLLLTSQQEGVITTVLGRLRQHCGIHYITFDNPRGEAPNKFMASSLEHLASKIPEISGKDNLGNLRQSLMERSMSVPTWTHTLFDFLSFCDDHRESFPGMWHTLQQILSSPFPLSKEDAMDNLYRIILSSLPYPTHLVKELLLSFVQSAGGLSSINAHRSILPTCTYHGAFGEEASNCPILQAMQMLGLLVGKGKAENESLFTLSPDFRDFLTNERRCHGTMFSVGPREACKVAVERIKAMGDRFGLYCCRHEVLGPNSITSSQDDTTDSLHYAYLTWIFCLESCGVNCLNFPDDYSLLLTTLEEFIVENISDWMQYLGSRRHRMEPRELQLSFLRRLERWAKHHLSSTSITAFKSCLHRMHMDVCTIISSEPSLLQGSRQEWKDLDALISRYQAALREYQYYTRQQDNDMRKKSWILCSHNLATALFKRYKLVRNKSRLQQWRLIISDLELPGPCLRDLKEANEVEHGAKGLLRCLGSVKVTRLELDETCKQVQRLVDVLMSHIAAVTC
ncbi:hypothetical protein CPC08DRAFT_252779 [Agrocybe pediades]|nr:hypothetical protein CPC08DRAFT_252779 [Agrocybe pediades]